MKNKNVYIIAGSNGAGKTTFAKTFLAEYAKCDHFVNADLIALGLSPFSPRQAAIKAGKLVLEQIKQFTDAGIDFGFETTLSGVTYLKYLQRLKQEGYTIHIFFLWIPGFELAIGRIKDRVEQGGHSVPSEDVKRRFGRSLENFWKEYRPLAEQWMLFDNSQTTPQLIARKQNANLDVLNPALLESITKKAGIPL